MSNAAQFIFTMHKVGRFHAARPRGPRGHLPVLLPRRQDRRHRPQRVGQVLAAADHGGDRRRLHGRGPPLARLHRRHARAGAAARRDQGRQGQRHGRRGRGGRRCSSATTRSSPSTPTPTPTTRRSAPSRPSSRPRSRPAAPSDLDRHIEIAMDALRLPPGDADVTTLSGGERRRVALCRLLLSQPDLLLLDEPTNHLDAESVAWLERTLRDYPGTVVAITHDRYFLDNVARWILELERGEGIPFEGNYSSWLEQKQARLDRGGEAGLDAPAHARARARVGAHGPQGPPGEGQGPPLRVREAAGRGRSSRPRPGQAADPAARRSPPRRRGHRGRRGQQGLRRPAPGRGPRVQAAARRHRRRHRPQRRGQDHAVPDDHRAGGSPTPDPSRSATRSTSPTSTRAATPSTRTTPSTRRSPAAPTR